MKGLDVISAKNYSNKFSSVVMTGDILRTGLLGSTPNQNKNISWLYSILKAPVGIATARPVNIFRSDPDDGFSIDYFYSLLGVGMLPSINNWAALFSDSELPEAAVDYVVGHFEDRLVVGFEIPPIFCRLLDGLNIPYIDVTIHPVRFGHELMLGMRSNVKKVQDRLIEFSCKEEDHFTEAVLYKAGTDKLPEFEPGILVCGQTLGDRVSINAGRFCSLMDFGDELMDLIGDSSVAYFRRHPLIQYDHDVIRFMAGSSKIKFTTANFYDMLCSGNVTNVVSLSSGASTEAKYFDVPATFLLKEPNLFYEIHGDDKNSRGNEVYSSIKDWLFDSDWWRYVLCLSDVRPTTLRRLSSASPIRSTLKQNWGLNIGTSQK